jgi:hypothetical protein
MILPGVFLIGLKKLSASITSVVASASYGDIMEDVRLSLNENSLDNIEEIFMERSGKISVIKKTD